MYLLRCSQLLAPLILLTLLAGFAISCDAGKQLEDARQRTANLLEPGGLRDRRRQAGVARVSGKGRTARR